MIIGLKSPGPECAHRSALAHRDWLSSSHRRGARRSPPVAALPYSVFGLHRNLRCRCDLAPTRQSIGNSFHAGAGWGIFFAFCLPPLKILGIKVLTRGACTLWAPPRPFPSSEPLRFRGPTRRRRGGARGLALEGPRARTRAA